MRTVSAASVTVLIVNWNGHRDTIACIDSLGRSLGIVNPAKVVIVDNASSDDSRSSIRRHLADTGWQEKRVVQVTTESSRVAQVSQFNSNRGAIDSLILVEARSNYGFAAGNNIGRNLANELWASEFFWLLNNDTIVAPDALSILIKKMYSQPNVAVCGCAILYADGTQRVQSYGGAWYSVRTGRGWSVGMDEVYDASRSDSSVEQVINYVSGAAMLIRECAWEGIGPLCEDYFLFNEEIDFAIRLPQGQRLGVANKAIIYHRVGATIGTEKVLQIGSRLSAFFQTRSKLLFAGKHTPQYWPVVWLFLLGRALKFILNPATRKNALVILSVLGGRRIVDNKWFNERIITHQFADETSDSQYEK